MNILHVGKYYCPAVGGIERFLHDLAKTQVELGHTVSVLAHNDNPYVLTHGRILDGVQVVRVLCLGELIYTPVSPTFLFALRQQVRKSARPDVIHLHLPNVSAFFALAAPRDIPLIVHWHADVMTSIIDKRFNRIYSIYKRFESALLHRAQAIIVTSSAYLEASRTLRSFRDKCRVVPLGLDRSRIPQCKPEDVKAVRSRYPGQYLIAAVGRFTYYKGFEYLIKAMRLVPGASLVIVGDGVNRPAMQRLLRDYQLEDRVFLPGRLSEHHLHAHFAACDVFCLPSIERTEAFGIVLLEAMIHGKPLVTTDIPGSGVGFVNVSGETGQCVPIRDAEKLGSVLRDILSDQAGRLAMGEVARKRVVDHFDILKIANGIDTIYADCF